MKFPQQLFYCNCKLINDLSPIRCKDFRLNKENELRLRRKRKILKNIQKKQRYGAEKKINRGKRRAKGKLARVNDDIFYILLVDLGVNEEIFPSKNKLFLSFLCFSISLFS